MFTFTTLLGIALLLLVAVYTVIKKFVPEEDHPEFIKSIRKPVVTGGLIAGTLLSLSSFLFFYSFQGNQYYLVYPNGSWGTQYTPGIKWRGLARIQEWQKQIDVKVVGEGDPTDGVEGVITDKTTFTVLGDKGQRIDKDVPGIAITFIDRVHGAVMISLRMTMPQNPDDFRIIAESFKSQENLISNTIIPTIREQVSNTGYQYAAQDYISGAATDFRQALDDQLKYGGYSTERHEFSDTVYASIQIGGARTIKEINTRYKIIRNVDKAGKLIRIPHEISKNNVAVTQVIVDKVTPEPAFQQRLEAQRDISAQKRIEMEKIETAKAAQQRIIAEGERDKAEERVTQEKEQVKVLIAVETDLKKESTKKQLAEITLQTERINAEATLVKERAQAEANRLKVAAGLTPQERALFEKETAIGVAEKIAGPNGLQFPQTYIQGGQGSKEGNLLETLIGAKLAEQMLHSKP